MISMKKKIKSNRISYLKPIDAMILIALFVMFIMLTIGLSVGTYQYKENQVLLIKDCMNIFSDNQKVQFQQFIDSKVAVLEGLAQYPDIYRMDEEQQEKFIKGRSKKLGFHHIFVMRAEGTGYYIDEGVIREQGDEPFYQSVMENEIYITEPFYSPEHITMTVSVSIYDKFKRKVGALCGAFELTEIEKLFAQNEMFLGGKLWLINREGKYIVADDIHKIYSKEVIYDAADADYSLIRAAFEQRTDVEGVLIQNGEEYITNVTYLAGYDWVIVQCVEESAVYKDLRYIDWWNYFSIGLICIIIIGVVRITLYWYQSVREVNIDTLTKSNSRIYMQNLLEQLERDYKHDIALIYFDLNKFKYVNDTFGHDEGDRILCIFAEVLEEVFRKRGCVGRLGGDEFLVVGVGLTQDEVLKLCHAVEEHLVERSGELAYEYVISTSYGFAIREKGSQLLIEDILSQADENMYRFKEAGKQLK
ncbi:MAG: GGDEF domain-containing protein [Lachnospiraceae bacterium]|nr:GGDEF domain-containing protein [Lachnospiraceae bacterium]